jgi:hypothetical protein
MKWIWLIVSLAALPLAGCNQNAPPSAPVAGAVNHEPTQAQPKLATIRLWLGAEEVKAEMALNSEQVRTGMMFRTNLDEMAGMIFVFTRPVQAEFWMKNCPLPLSCAYIDPQGAIAEIHDLKAQDTNTVVAASDNIQYVLEVNQGWFARHHVTEGIFVRTERGTLGETFFGANR